VSDRVVRAYRRELFGKSILQDLPDKPTFVFNATNLESGVLFRFSKPYLADYRVGRVMDPDLPMAVAVAASSAFPPILSPCTIDLSKEEWLTDSGNDLVSAEFRDELTLTDGGVYDNLGIETAWKRYRTILVSDGGGHLVPDPDPAHNWGEQMVRVLKVIDNQVRALRKRQIIEAFKSSPGEADHRDGVYVGIRSHVADYGLDDRNGRRSQNYRRTRRTTHTPCGDQRHPTAKTNQLGLYDMRHRASQARNAPAAARATALSGRSPDDRYLIPAQINPP
jgi:NTE family protein